MLLAQAMSADRSCQYIVNQTALQRLAGGLASGSTHTGGYCLAGQRLPLDMVSTLTRHLSRLTAEQVLDERLWHHQVKSDLYLASIRALLPGE